MTLSELLEQLKTTGYNVAYSHFKEKTAPPFITVLRTEDINISSDFKVLGTIRTYLIELYTQNKELEAEAKVEDILAVIDTEYQTTESYIDSEKLYQIVYRVSLIERR